MNKLGAAANRLRDLFPLIALLTAVSFYGQVTDPAETSPADSLNTPVQTLDTVPQIAKDTVVPSGPIVVEKNKRYLIGGVSVVGNETISEQSILIFSGKSLFIR